MAVFWLIVFILALAAMIFIARPIILGAVAAPAASDSETILRQRLDAIERDLECGLIDEKAAEEARREAQTARDLPSATPEGDLTASGRSRWGRLAALFYLGAAPLAAVLLYINIGSPQFLNSKAQGADPASPHASAEQDLAALEARAAAAPDDFEAWTTLGEAYVIAGRANDALRAFSKALAIDENNPDARSAYGEALVMQANGAVTMEARKAFEKALEIAPGDPRSRYYLAEARYQVGATEEAVRAWAALLNDAPAGAPWFAAVAAEMQDAAAEAGLDLSAIGLNAEATRRLASAGAAMNKSGAEANDLEAMLGRIHDGTASFEDWLNAAAAYVEQGEEDNARDILQRAAKRYQNAPFVLAQIKKAQAQLDAGGAVAPSSPEGGVRGPTQDQVAAVSAMPEDQQQQMIKGMVAGLAQRLADNPDNPEGWRMLGRSYAVLGRPKDSADAWRELLKRVDGGPDDWRAFASALMDQRPDGDNAVSEELEGALEKLRSFNADDPLALYNLGYAARDKGDNETARALWSRLRKTLPPDAPLAPTLDKLIENTKGG